MVLSLARAVHGEIYLGTNDGHVFAADRGVNRWELRGRAGSRTDAVVAQLAADPAGPGRVFAAVWFREAGAGGGVYRSEDGGRSWVLAGLQEEAVRALEFAPSQPQMLVAGTRSGVFRSANSGKTWEAISPPGDPELRNVDSVAVDPADPNTIYAGTYHLPWKTTDGGKTWKPVTAGLIDDSDIMSMRVDASNPERLYLSACSGIYRSDNRGEQWTKLQGIPYSARRTHAIVQDPANPAALYAATTEGLWVTRDAGENWQRTTPRDWVVNGVVVLPATSTLPARVLIGTESEGVLVSSDFGTTFTAANRGFTHPVLKQFASDSKDSSHLLLLLERHGGDLLESHDAGTTWTGLSAVDAPPKASAWSARQIARIYGSPWGWMASLRNGSLWKFDEQRRLWEPWKASYAVASRPATRGASATTVAKHRATLPTGILDFSLANAYLPVTEGLLRCGRSGQCMLMPAFTRIMGISAIWISDDDQRLAIAADGKLGLSGDGGLSAIWHDLPSDLRTAHWIVWDGKGSSDLLSASEQGLFRSQDSGVRWTRVREGLPAGVFEQGLRSGVRLLVTFEQGGIYASPDGAKNWTRLDQDAERSRITSLSQTQANDFLFGSQSEGLLLWSASMLHAP
jgi:photosystem II stability/assembly factor-like uncharacterized protein